MSAESNINAAIARHRKRLDSLEDAALAIMYDEYEEIARRQMAELSKLINELDHLRRTDPGAITIGRIYRTERTRSFFLQAEREWQRYATKLGVEVDKTVQRAADLAYRDASELSLHALGDIPPGVDIEALFTQLPTNAIADIAGIVSSGPLRTILEEYGSVAARGLATELVSGIAGGLHPRQVADRMSGLMGGNLARARTIARTEMLRSYREGQARFYRSQRVVKYWTWHSATDRRTCPTCWVLHGTKWPKEESFGTHPNCRCAMVPVSYTWKELGFNVPDRFESSYVPTPGKSLFKKLPEADKKAILGKKAYKRYAAGELELEDFIREKLTPDWGVTRSTMSVKGAIARRKRLGGKNPYPDLYRDPPIGKAPLPLDDRARNVLRSRRAAEASRRARAEGTVKPKPKQKVEKKLESNDPAYLQEINTFRGGRATSELPVEDVQFIGKKARAEIDKRAGVDNLAIERRKLSARHKALTEENERLFNEIQAINKSVPMSDPLPDDLWKARRKLLDRKNEIREELDDIVSLGQKIAEEIHVERLKATREVLGEIRPFGNGKPINWKNQKGIRQQSHSFKFGADKDIRYKATDVVDDVAKNFPDEWWDAWSDIVDKQGFKARFIGRGKFSTYDRTVYLSPRSGGRAGLEGIANHEIGHAMEHSLKEIRRLEQAFYDRRTRGERLVKMNDVVPGAGYRRDEITRLDAFLNPYMGKDYGGHWFELLSMGHEWVFTPYKGNRMQAELWDRDTDFLDFILGLLAAV